MQLGLHCVGKPTQNSFVASFIGRLRDEFRIKKM